MDKEYKVMRSSIQLSGSEAALNSYFAEGWEIENAFIVQPSEKFIGYVEYVLSRRISIWR